MKHCHYLITLIQPQPFSLIAFLQKQNPSKVMLRISCSIEISCSSIVRLIFTISFELKALRILLALPSSLYFEAYFWLKENRFSFTNNVTLFWKPSFSLLIFFKFISFSFHLPLISYLPARERLFQKISKQGFDDVFEGIEERANANSRSQLKEK